MRRLLALLICLLSAGFASAGTQYEVTSKKGDEAVTYTVNFGGGKLFEMYTAFDPQTKQFVYLSFERRGEAPKPKAVIWDHTTGRTIELYAFPGVEQPLPIIPSIEAMKSCPLTGDKNFVAKATIIFD